MWRNPVVISRGIVVGIAALLAAGCAESSTEPIDVMGPDLSEALGLFLAEGDGAAGWSAEVVANQRAGSHDFSRAARCPAGGSRSVAGSMSSSLDAGTRTFSTTWSTTETHEGCAMVHSRRNQRILVVIDGSVSVTGAASYQLPEERGGPRSILAYTSHRFGSTTTSIGDRVQPCEIDITTTYDPATQSFHVTGSVCGRTVDVTRGPAGPQNG